MRRWRSPSGTRIGPRLGLRPLPPYRVNRKSPQYANLDLWVPVDWPYTHFHGNSEPGVIADLSGQQHGLNRSRISATSSGGDNWALVTDHLLGCIVAKADGTNSVGVGSQVNNSSAYKQNRDFSFACWFNPANITTYIAIAGHGTNGWYLRMNNNGTLGFLEAEVTGILSGSTSLAANKWHHVGVTISTGTTCTITLYLNGKADGATTTTTNFNTGSANLCLAACRGSENPNGRYSDFRIYNKRLQPNIFKQMYDPATRWDLYAPVRGAAATPAKQKGGGANKGGGAKSHNRQGNGGRGNFWQTTGGAQSYLILEDVA